MLRISRGCPKRKTHLSIDIRVFKLENYGVGQSTRIKRSLRIEEPEQCCADHVLISNGDLVNNFFVRSQKVLWHRIHCSYDILLVYIR